MHIVLLRIYFAQYFQNLHFTFFCDNLFSADHLHVSYVNDPKIEPKTTVGSVRKHQTDSKSLLQLSLLDLQLFIHHIKIFKLVFLMLMLNAKQIQLFCAIPLSNTFSLHCSVLAS